MYIKHLYRLVTAGHDHISILITRSIIINIIDTEVILVHFPILKSKNSHFDIVHYRLIMSAVDDHAPKVRASTTNKKNDERPPRTLYLR